MLAHLSVVHKKHFFEFCFIGNTKYSNTYRGDIDLYQKIDLNTWNRTHLFRSYQNTDFPYINIGCELDVTPLYEFTQKEHLSFYFAMVGIATQIADEIENFRYRFKDDEPFIIDRNTAFATHLEPGEEVFKMVECEHCDSIPEFARINREKAKIPLPYSGLAAMKDRMDILNFTMIPWIHYTHFIRTIQKDGIDCIPKISMGKYSRENGKVLMPFSTQTHHGLMDGYHVGRYFTRLEEYLLDEGWK